MGDVLALLAFIALVVYSVRKYAERRQREKNVYEDEQPEDIYE